jgi:serine/threonine protein kinase
MQALYRIVQDDSPPIPEGASPIVKDFLYHCFQKDCNLRISAKKLLRHPWMLSAKKQMSEGKCANGQVEGSRPLSNYNFDEAVLKVQEWNEALRCESAILSVSKPIKHASSSSISAFETRWTWPLGCGSAGSTCIAYQSTLQRVIFSCCPCVVFDCAANVVCCKESGSTRCCQECCASCASIASRSKTA